jgi:hypothetical protein
MRESLLLAMAEPRINVARSGVEIGFHTAWVKSGRTAALPRWSETGVKQTKTSIVRTSIYLGLPARTAQASAAKRLTIWVLIW